MSETGEPPATLPPAKDNSRKLLVIAALASAATLAIVLLMVFNYMRTFTITGTATTNPASWAQSSCRPYGQFHSGAQVTVYDNSGALVGVGQLNEGTPVSNYRCQYTFTIRGVKDGSPYYQVQVDESNKVMYNRHDVESVALEPKF